MTLSRCIGWSLIVMVLFGEFGVLGFRKASDTHELIALLAAWIVLTICRAHDSILSSIPSPSSSGGES